MNELFPRFFQDTIWNSLCVCEYCVLIHECLYSGGLIFRMLCALVICGLGLRVGLHLTSCQTISLTAVVSEVCFPPT